MSRYLKAKLKIIKRLGPLPGFTAKVDKESEEANKVEKVTSLMSDYRAKLKEKQKLKVNYGVSERQLRKLTKKAQKKSIQTGHALLKFLEMRLDSVIYMLGFCCTIPAARQVVTHGNVLVNSRSVNIPSFQCSQGDKISFKLKYKGGVPKDTTSYKVPSFLKRHESALEGQVVTLAPRPGVKLQIKDSLIVEYYARK